MRTDLLWAKTERGTPLRWHPLAHHLLEAAAVGEALWTSWVAAPLRQALASWLGDDDAARSFVAWLCGAHDLGKASPAFQWQVPELAEGAKAAGYRFSPLALADNAAVTHATVSALAVRTYLCDAGWSDQAAKCVGELVGGHHGRFPSDWTTAGDRWPNVVGTGEWIEARKELASTLARHVGFDASAVRRSDVPSPPVRLVMAGLVTVADWLASNASKFPYDNCAGAPAIDTPLGSIWERARNRAEDAVRKALAPSAWVPREFPNATEAFCSRFPGKQGPRPLQEVALTAARWLGGPGILVVEGPTGEGKTEAALIAAEALAAATGASGLFFALPTRATGNQIFRRLRRWLSGQPGTHTVALAHANAWLEPAYAELLTRGPADVGRDEPAVSDGTSGSVVATEWLAGRRRPLLARFVAGTVDQLLYAALASRFVALRHLGLCGKVVVVDEVHAYDAYMSVFLHRALQWLGTARVPVILLTATLTPKQRRELLQAYLGREPDEVADASIHPSVVAVAAVDGDGAAPRSYVKAAEARLGRRRLAVEMVEETDNVESVARILRDRLAGGGCALVLRNTVRRAQDTYSALRTHLDWPIGLFHSRFTVDDRQRLEATLVECFGANAHERPDRYVLVATQVVEQSLDVDFDLLVTDLAPVDLLVQRAGRVHRHARGGRPSGVAVPTMVVCGWRMGIEGPTVPPGSAWVYSEHSLIRTWAVLRDCPGGGIEVPGAVPALLEAVYGPCRRTPGDLAGRLERLLADEEATIETSKAQAKQFALKRPPTGVNRLLASLFPPTMLDGGDDDPVARASVRAGEPGPQVVLVAPGEGLPAGGSGAPSEPAQLKALLRRVVTLPAYLDHDVRALQKPWVNHPLLRHLWRLELEGGTARIGSWEIRYSAEEGLRVDRATEER